VKMDESFEEMPTKKRLNVKEQWEETVFEAAEVDESDIKAYLDNFFEANLREDGAVSKAFKELKDAVQEIENDLAEPDQFNHATLAWTIQSLLAGKLLTDEKREVLKDFKNNSVILSEIADVLNMRMSAIGNWTWGHDAIPVEQRRRLNGTYDLAMHEDLLQAIFLQYIGILFSVRFKDILKSFSKTKHVWMSLGNNLSKTDRMRRKYYLGHESTKSSVSRQRRAKFRQDYFLSQLLDLPTQEIVRNEGEIEMEFDMEDDEEAEDASLTMLSSMPLPSAKRAPSVRFSRLQRTDSDSDNDDDFEAKANDAKNPMEIKQRLLHLLATEISINTKLHGEFTCFRTAFEQWNNMLPHQTILVVLNYFGVSQKWLGFFKKFLEAPLRLVDDPPSAEARIRRRGVPNEHTLSDFFSEVVLFCLDFSVNQATDGALLYRMFDDLWFWAPVHSTCVNSWKAITQFTRIMRVILNRPKSGTVRIAQDRSAKLDIDRSLPSGSISWGFLYLNPITGQFDIDLKLVDKHIEELRNQLKSQEYSVFTWIQTWNTYACRFFSSNFCKPANCFGQDIVDKILEAHSRVHCEIFGSSGGSVVGHLKAIIQERFKVKDIPDGFFFFPNELGGLDLESPFISLLQVRDTIVKSPTKLLEDYEKAQIHAYRQAKERFENGTVQNGFYDHVPDGVDRDNFMSFDEFRKYAEDLRPAMAYKNDLPEVFRCLLETPIAENVILDPAMTNALNALGKHGGSLRGILSQPNMMEPYWIWVVQMYGPAMVETFGGLNVVDKGLLPMAMVGMVKGKTIKWRG
jgi:hypothetical protein